MTHRSLKFLDSRSWSSAFIVVSVVALTSQGQWPSRIGPVHIREAMSGQEIENGQLRGSLASAERTIEDLQQDVAAYKELGKESKG
jgi:hypothetical protein